MESIEWSKLTKEQKQYVMLGGIVAIALVYVLYTVVGGMLTADPKASGKVNLDQLRQQVEKAEGTIRRERLILREYQETVDFLENEASRYFPNEDNRYAWVTELIYSQARLLEVEIQSIDELARPPGQGDVIFTRYAVQVNMASSYAKTVEFLRYFEESNPLMRVTRLSVAANDRDAINHTVSIVMEWPASMKIRRVKGDLPGGA